MNGSYDKTAAVVVLPPIRGGRLTDKSLRAWLAQSDLSQTDAPQELLATILAEVGLPYPEQGLAALRMWGQTGDRPTVWIAAADPVYLEPRLDHLCLHALNRSGIPASDLRPLFDHLQDTLAEDRRYGFARLGSYGYLRAREPISTSSVPAYVVDQREPGEFLPTGEHMVMHRNILSEIEMSLHEHEVNLRRMAEGKQPVNSLWLWGGGVAPEKTTRPQPPLFADDPLLAGYWESATAVGELWPGNFAACADASLHGFVAVTPENDFRTATLEAYLTELHQMLRSNRVSRLILLFRDGVRADVRRSDTLKFWRRDSELLD
ncbi:MAG: hypothetical protein OEY37_06450 [Gammaproteobacteria bacterium]|nr:hypothetical protein [Gammaproteobacteria bacterium]